MATDRKARPDPKLQRGDDRSSKVFALVMAVTVVLGALALGIAVAMR